jgi:fibronectin type III domain protein
MSKKLFTNLLLVFSFLMIGVGKVDAFANLVADCPAYGACALSNDPPAGPIDPMFQEIGWYPGSVVTQYIRISNSSSQNGFAALEVVNYVQTPGLRATALPGFDVGDSINIFVYSDTPYIPANLIYGGVTLAQFRDDSYFTIDTLNAGQSRDYYFVAQMQTTSGNEYQAGVVKFDLNVGLEVEPLPATSGGGDGTGSVAGISAPGPASPPVCHDAKPGSAPANFHIVSTGINTITLAWNPVNPVSHYALIFTRNSDGAQYGASNIGNVTSYTINNLSGGDSYTFEIFGVNSCMPGDRTAVSSANIPGGLIEGRPFGPGGQVLGVTDEDATPEAEFTDQGDGQVAGATDVCKDWKLYIPWILLVAQIVLTVGIDYYFKKDHQRTKLYIAIGITLASIAIFYLVRECQCYTQVSLLTWLCKWYWAVSLTIALLIRVFAYAFIEEVEE